MGAPTIQSGVNNVLCLFSLSIFGRVEAPNLRPQVELEAWLVHDTGKPPRYVLLLCTPVYSQAYFRNQPMKESTVTGMNVLRKDWLRK